MYHFQPQPNPTYKLALIFKSMQHKEYVMKFKFVNSLIMVLTLMVLTFSTSGVTPAFAATLIVTNNADSGAGSLRDTLAIASAGDTITFDPSLAGQTIALASTLMLDRDVTIDGSALTTQVTISGDTTGDGTGDVQVFNIDSNATVNLNSLTITKGSAIFGAGIYNQGVLTVTNSVFSDNIATYDAGAILNYSKTLTVIDSTFSNNIAQNQDAGAISNYWSNAILTVTHSTFIGNKAPNGSGGAIGGGGGNVLDTFTLTDSTFINNTAHSGGAIALGREATVTNSTFSGNSATNGSGGAIYVWMGTPTVANSTFYNNSAAADGGGLYSFYSTVTVINNTFSDNSAANGGGIANLGTLNFSNNIVANSTSGDDCYNINTINTNLNNVVEDGTCSENSLNFKIGDPNLDVLADNGGLTQTMALLPGSRALGAGDAAICTADPVNGLDQRSAARPQGDVNCDIGAYESSVLYTLPAPGAFVKSSPANGAISVAVAPMLSWGLSIDQTDYEYCYDSTINGTCNAAWTSTSNLTSVVLSGLNYSTQYEWQVRAINATDTIEANGGIWWTFTTTSVPIIWNGPTINFTKANFVDWTLPANQDQLTANVWLTRANTKGLFNIAQETGYSLTSPADTEWAYGTLADYASLTYQPWVNWNVGNPPSTVGQEAVLHLISENIYLSIKFTLWSENVTGGGGFSYQRSTPPGPAASINPASWDFGSQSIGTTSPSKSFTLTNTGVADLVIGTLSASGNFTLTSDLCSGKTILPSATCTFDIIYSPISLGANIGLVSIPSNSVASPDSVRLKGTTPGTFRLLGTVGNSSGTSDLVELDPSSGALINTIGAVGYLVNGLDYDPVSGKLYATTSANDAAFKRGLLTIDMTSGAGTPIGLGDSINYASINNLRADANGKLFAWGVDQNDLLSFDAATGGITVIGSSRIHGYSFGMSFNAANTLYFVNGDGSIYTVDTASGAGTYTGVNISGIAHHGDFNPSSGEYWGIDATNTGPKNLVAIDVATGVINQTLPTVSNLHTLTFTNVVAPVVDLSLSTWDFGSQIIGTTSAEKSFTLTNNGNANLVVGTLSASGQFALTADLCSGQTVAAGSACTFGVTFSPTTIGAKTGSISIPSNAASSPNSISLNGNGTPSDVTPPTVLSITRVNPSPTNLASVDFTVTFSEPVTGVDMTGPTFDDFSLTTSSGITGAFVTSVSGSDTTYTVTVNTGTGNGTLRLNVGTGGSIADAVNNPLEAGFTTGQIYSIIKTATFSDVPLTYWANNYIERLYFAGITSGCGTSPLTYCPDQGTTRAQLAILLLRSMHGASYLPPAVGASTGFNDVPSDYWAAAWIKQLAAEGITSGCGNGNYCPETVVTRSQLAVLLLRAEHGNTYTPPTATGLFTDVPANYWAADWIEALAVEGITTGCGGGIFCPETNVTRDQMAVFLVRAFNLP